MSKLALPVRPAVLYGLVKELRVSARDDRPLVVAGAPELARALARELGRDGKPGALREGGSFVKAAALVYVLAGALAEEDERELEAADKQRTPIIVLAAAETKTVPYVLATDIVRVGKGEALPVDAIARAVVRRLGEDAAPLAARLPALRAAAARELVNRCARKNGVIGAAVFVPGADLPLLTLNQARMVLRIAQVYGHEVEQRRALELLGVLGGGLGLRTVARELLDFLPGPGWILKGAVAYGGTRALGEAAIKYFEAI